MSDIRTTLELYKKLEENCAGAVASVAMPLGSTQKRIKEEGPEAAPKVKGMAFGDWKNKALAPTPVKVKKAK
jgi:hypothetical protein